MARQFSISTVLFFAIFCVFWTEPVPAQEPAAPGLEYYLPADAKHDPAAPTPESVLGWRFGEWHLRHHELVSYLAALDAWSDRIVLREYARSHGRRPLLLLTIASPENQAKIDRLRREHLARLESAFEGEEPDTAGAPLIVWMGYGVHGNEPSASQAAVLLAYHLAASRDPATRRLLDRTVILLEPCLNPDGMDRFAEWTNSHRGALPSAHRSDREHKEGWPSGRSNYYWFDLNRDWLPATQPESQGRLRVYHEWQPHLVTDYHEMGNRNRTYFFQPGVPEMTNPLIPARTQELTARIAEGTARALDGIGSLYYTRESFDDFYPGKGSTYPDLCGSVGILYEQAGSRGYRQDTEHGRLVFPFTIRNHVVTSLATLRSADVMRDDLAAHQLDFQRETRAQAAESPVKAHLVAAAGDPARLDAFRQLLDRHGIRHGAPAETVKAGGRQYPAAESIVIPAEQPRHGLLTAMMERRTEFEGAVFYDVSAWRLPSAYGLRHEELKVLPPLLEGPPPPATRGRVTGAAKPVAYLIPWEPLPAPAVLWQLVEADLRVWVARRPIVTGGEGARVTHPEGTLVLPVAVQAETRQAAALRKLLRTVAARHGQSIHGVGAGLSAADGIDLGSPSLSPLRRPRVALLTGPGVGSATAGDLWHQFDRIWQAPLTMIEASQIGSSLLRDFDTLLLPDLSFTGLPSGAKTTIQSWVGAGGTLIAIGSTVSSLAAQDWAKAELVKADFGPTPADAKYADSAKRQALRQIKGVIVRATFDPTHPLAFGYAGQGDRIELFRTGTTFLAAPDQPALAPLRHGKDSLVSGFIAEANLKALTTGSVPVRIRPSGSGRVILFTENPVFRGHWHGSSKLLANAIFFGPIVSAPSGEGGSASKEPGSDDPAD